MPPKFIPRRKTKVNLFTKFRAWWHGVDNAEALAKYGERGVLSTIWMEWKGTLILLGCALSFVIGRQQSNRANYFLDNIELNRQKYYRKDFAPGYVEGAPPGVYDGPKGYSYKDKETGLALNADNKYILPGSREEGLSRVDNSTVTKEMVESAERLLSSKRYAKFLPSYGGIPFMTEPKEDSHPPLVSSMNDGCPRTRIESRRATLTTHSRSSSSSSEKQREEHNNRTASLDGREDDSGEDYYKISEKEHLTVEERVKRLNERNKERLAKQYDAAPQPGVARRPSVLFRTRYRVNRSIKGTHEGNGKATTGERRRIESTPVERTESISPPIREESISDPPEVGENGSSTSGQEPLEIDLN